MSSWAEVAAAEPEFADRVRRVFDAHRHKVLAAPQDDPGSWLGDAKIGGRAIEVVGPSDEDEPAHRFQVDIAEVVLIRVGRPADHLVIESWHEGRGLERKQRK